MTTKNLDVPGFFESKGIKYTRVHEDSGPHLIVSPCPLCKSVGSTNRPFYINELTGQYNTYCCDSVGNMYTLRKHFGEGKIKKDVGIAFKHDKSKADINEIRKKMKEKAELKPDDKGRVPTISDVQRWQNDLFSNQEANEYLQSRGITTELAEYFNLGYARRKQKDGNEYGYITIPSVLNNEVRVLKLRIAKKNISKDEESFKWVRIKGMQSHIFNERAIHEDSERKRIFICEAELDAIAAHKIGLRPVVSVTTGSKNFNDEWIHLFEDYDEIYFLYDQYDDDPKSGKHDGDDGAEKAATKLGKFRCKRVVFPYHDVCAWMESGPTEQEVNDVVSLAIPYYKAELENIYEASVRIQSNNLVKPTTTGLDFLDKILGGGISPGEVAIVTADTSIGKTTFATNIVRAMADNGVSSIYWPIEGSVDSVAKKIWSQLLWDDWSKVIESDRIKFDTMIAGLRDSQIYVWGKGYQDQTSVYDLLNVFARRGGNVLVVDHLHKLVMLEKSERAEREKIDSWIAFFCEVAKEFGLRIILIAHPSKPKGEKGEANDESFEPDLHDGKGSSSIYQDPDIYIVLSRTRTKNRDSADEKAEFVPTKLTLKKMRDDRTPEASCAVMFHRKSTRYMSVQTAIAIGYKNVSTSEIDNKEKKSRKKSTDDSQDGKVVFSAKEAMKKGFTKSADTDEDWR